MSGLKKKEKKKSQFKTDFSHFANDVICYAAQPEEEKRESPVLVAMLAGKNYYYLITNDSHAFILIFCLTSTKQELTGIWGSESAANIRLERQMED